MKPGDIVTATRRVARVLAEPATDYVPRGPGSLAVGEPFRRVYPVAKVGWREVWPARRYAGRYHQSDPYCGGDRVLPCEWRWPGLPVTGSKADEATPQKGALVRFRRIELPEPVTGMLLAEVRRTEGRIYDYGFGDERYVGLAPAGAVKLWELAVPLMSGLGTPPIYVVDEADCGDPS